MTYRFRNTFRFQSLNYFEGFLVNEQLSFSLTHSQDNAAKGLLDLYEMNLPAYIGAVHFHVHTTLPPGHDNPMPPDPWIRSTESRNRILNVTLASIAL